MAEPGGAGGRRLHVTPVRAVAASVVVAAVAGLSIGAASKPEPLDREEVRRQALSDSGEATLVEVRQEIARQGFRDGRKLGLKRGRQSGSRAGRADGRIRVQISKIRRAQSAAERAEAALAEISEPPPTPGG